MTNKIEELKKLKTALESGKYPKTKNTLKGNLPDGSVGYCCLGVYATINGYEPDTIEGYYDEEDSGDWVYDDEGDEVIYQKIRNIFGDPNVELLIGTNDSSDTWEPVIKCISCIEEEK